MPLWYGAWRVTFFFGLFRGLALWIYQYHSIQSLTDIHECAIEWIGLFKAWEAGLPHSCKDNTTWKRSAWPMMYELSQNDIFLVMASLCVRYSISYKCDAEEIDRTWKREEEESYIYKSKSITEKEQKRDDDNEGETMKTDEDDVKYKVQR